ncbi:MAG: fibronectin type III domain-containing protein [Planctomyces sp.]
MMKYTRIFRPRVSSVFTRLIPLVLILSVAAGLNSGHAQNAETVKLVPQADKNAIYQPGLMPDRIILTWSGDPSTTQSVTWRTSAEVTRGLAEIAPADGAPDLQAKSRQVIAATEPLKTDVTTAHCHSVTFEGLTPATRYAYRVGDGVNWSEWFHFSTASASAEPFSFLYFGDAQNDVRSLWSRVVREAWQNESKAKFLIHAGDLINRAEQDWEWGEWFSAGGWMNGMVPSIPVPGNHEMTKNVDGSRRLSVHWRPQFTLPQNGPAGLEETCYTMVCQGVRIIGMNSNEKLKEQAEWLEQVLSQNKEKWVICTFHHPIFSTGKDRDNAELRALWKPVLDKYRVDLVLQGHDHTYGRTGLDTPKASVNLATGVSRDDLFSGTVYVVSVSGPKMYSVQRHPFMVRHAENTQLYQLIHINGEKLHYEAFTAGGELYDAFTLEKQAGEVNRLTDQIPNTPERVKPPVPESPAKKAS